MKEASLCVIENKSGEILLLDRKHQPLGYGLVGGKVDKGETPLQAVIREVEEESGIHIMGYPIHYTGQCISATGDFMMHIYWVKLEHTPTVVLSNEHNSFIWSEVQVDGCIHEVAGNTELMIEMYIKYKQTI